MLFASLFWVDGQMNFTCAKRMETLGAEEAFEVLAKARTHEKQGNDIVYPRLGFSLFLDPPTEGGS